jgi:chromosomal replication initiation ATPase DnaA
MSIQKFFHYNFSIKNDESNFFVNKTNKKVFDISTLTNFNQNIFLYGPRKSGKTHLINIWKEKNKAVIYNNNFSELIKTKKNIGIDDALSLVSEEKLFHLINHCKLFNLKMYLTSTSDLSTFKFKYKDLYSRLREFYFLEFKIPDEEMCKMLMTKLFSEKQIIIKNKEIFDFIFNRINRSYYDVYLFVKKIDSLSLEKKRQLTIPLIKEIL